jgi:hypothetical protein
MANGKCIIMRDIDIKKSAANRVATAAKFDLQSQCNN